MKNKCVKKKKQRRWNKLYNPSYKFIAITTVSRWEDFGGLQLLSNWLFGMFWLFMDYLQKTHIHFIETPPAAEIFHPLGLARRRY